MAIISVDVTAAAAALCIIILLLQLRVTKKEGRKKWKRLCQLHLRVRVCVACTVLVCLYSELKSAWLYVSVERSSTHVSAATFARSLPEFCVPLYYITAEAAEVKRRVIHSQLEL